MDKIKYNYKHKANEHKANEHKANEHKANNEHDETSRWDKKNITPTRQSIKWQPWPMLDRYLGSTVYPEDLQDEILSLQKYQNDLLIELAEVRQKIIDLRKKLLELEAILANNSNAANF